ncbi:FprA family A-type flavoprotein [uncultured Bacteroides sp.]|uniref:FprA family A-type flavoprotein n=1 Tax=uncultured Bacteroides sp. TaxID=162156 RepID=UPI002AAC3AD8|nr:FprA family A-type flavoprotein [uncultured Bacteroides sp.]
MQQKITIKGKVHYVGVNDRSKSLFEAMWPLPYGVSYNSYLIDDDLVALVDTVDVCYFETFLCKIKSVIGDRPINYLIINHMEPDHSGSIRLIKQHYPNIVIVGNKQTFGMIEGFYGVTGEQYLVKDGDFLALGHHKLKFYLTPMVHWPETMMTFDETDGVLFSGDGFGAFGTLDGGFIDSRMNVDKFWDEMVRYYSNIVGKYGSPVQKALEKLKGLNITAICSTHGPVWMENIERVIGIYDKLSRYEAEEGVVIAYGSMYGNTEQMAETIAAELSACGIKNIVMHNVSKSHPSYIIADIFKYKGLIIGSPTYSNQLFPEVESLLSKIEVRDIKGRYLGYFGSFCWAGAAVKRLAEYAEKSKFELIGDPVEMKQGMKDITYTQCENLAKAMAERLEVDRNRTH